MICQLNMEEPATLSRIVQIQQLAYRIEAEIIGCDQLPPLNDTEDSLKSTKETFIGHYVGDELAGILSYKQEGSVLDICRLAIDPSYFRRGIASRLLAYVLGLDGITTWEVHTGKANRPAIRCYQKHGFICARELVTPDGIQIVKLRK
ncbi:GNAT family N-acetyltransferase [Laceyella putida]|uniref:GNAT family N-acetyltransferase n=1 Tax=Laceyella putida TaxID=110101 RepID=A0ABW2RHT9_9BACL